VRRSAERATASFTPLQCPRCGAEGIGRYCSNCGSALGRQRDLSVRHFLREAALAVTDFDSALIATFRSLLVRPGKLTVEYLHGARHRFLPPFRVFLLCNVLYFVAVDQLHTNVLTAPLALQADQMVYKNASRTLLEKRYPQIADRSTPLAVRDSVQKTITARYDGATEGIGKLIVVVLIPFYAVIFQLLFVGTKRFFAEHLVFSTHFVSFFLLGIPLAGLMTEAATWLLYRLEGVRLPDSETIYGSVLLAMISGYVYFAQRRAYESGRVATLLRTGIVAASVLPMVVGFKFVLFLATLAWIR
jgi:hypothetical protein